jgi:hypothetical protein
MATGIRILSNQFKKLAKQLGPKLKTLVKIWLKFCQFSLKKIWQLKKEKRQGICDKTFIHISFNLFQYFCTYSAMWDQWGPG